MKLLLFNLKLTTVHSTFSPLLGKFHIEIEFVIPLDWKSKGTKGLNIYFYNAYTVEWVKKNKP